MDIQHRASIPINYGRDYHSHPHKTYHFQETHESQVLPIERLGPPGSWKSCFPRHLAEALVIVVPNEACRAFVPLNEMSNSVRGETHLSTAWEAGYPVRTSAIPTTWKCPLQRWFHLGTQGIRWCLLGSSVASHIVLETGKLLPLRHQKLLEGGIR